VRLRDLKRTVSHLKELVAFLMDKEIASSSCPSASMFFPISRLTIRQVSKKALVEMVTGS